MGAGVETASIVSEDVGERDFMQLNLLEPRVRGHGGEWEGCTGHRWVDWMCWHGCAMCPLCVLLASE